MDACSLVFAVFGARAEVVRGERLAFGVGGIHDGAEARDCLTTTSLAIVVIDTGLSGNDFFEELVFVDLE